MFAQEKNAKGVSSKQEPQTSSTLKQKQETVPKEPLESSKTDEDELQKPNYPLWIVSLLLVIGGFYTIVFYVGTGLTAPCSPAFACFLLTLENLMRLRMALVHRSFLLAGQ